MDVEYLFITKINILDHFLTIFLTFFLLLSSTQTIKVIGLNFFNELTLKNCAKTWPFSKGGGGGGHRFRPPRKSRKKGEI